MRVAASVRETKQNLASQIFGLDDSLFETVGVHGASSYARNIAPLVPHKIREFGHVAQWSSDPSLSGMCF